MAQQDINPWNVTGKVGEDGKVKAINYNKLVDQFGTKVIDGALLARFDNTPSVAVKKRWSSTERREGIPMSTRAISIYVSS